MPTTIAEPRKKCYVRPIEGKMDEPKYYEGFRTLLQDAIEIGHKIGYELGKMFIYEEQSIKRYRYVVLSSTVKGKPENVITVPAGHFVSKCVRQSRIEHAEEEFPDLFKLDYKRIVLESELFSEDRDITKHEYELSCLLPDTQALQQA